MGFAESFFRFLVERPKIAFLITMMILLLGARSFSTLKRDSDPEVDFPVMTISTIYPGASPLDVELNVTNDIEDELRDITGIDRIESYSRDSVSVVIVVLDINADNIDEIKQDVREAVDRVTDLPAEVEDRPLVEEASTDTMPVIEVGLHDPNMSYQELRRWAKRFESELKTLAPVAKVERFGWLEREVRVELQPEKLHALQVGINDVVNAIGQRNIRSTAGKITLGGKKRSVITIGEFNTPEEVANVVIRTQFEGNPIRVRDVATIQNGYEEEKRASYINGKSAISFRVFKKKPSDIIRTVSAVEDLIASTKEAYPSSIEFLLTEDRSSYVRSAFNIVLWNGLVGLGAVLIILICFLGWRTAIWVALGIPVSVAGVFALMPVAGTYLDTISLISLILVIGIIVDDAIILSENIVQQREKGHDPVTAAVKGSISVAMPVLTTIATTFLAFAPMFLVTGVMGEFIFVIPLVITMALGVSVIEAFFALPGHLMWGLQHVKASALEGGNWFMRYQEKWKQLMYSFLRMRYLWTGVAVFTLIATLTFAAFTMRFQLFPPDAAEWLFIEMELEEGASVAQTKEKAAQMDAILNTLPENELISFITRIGEAFDPGDASGAGSQGEHIAGTTIYLTPYDQRDRNAEEILTYLRTEAKAITGVKKLNMRIIAGGPPVGKPITLRLVGSHEENREKLAADVMAYLKGIDGVYDLERSDDVTTTQVEVVPDYTAMALHGLNVGAVTSSLRIAFDGIEVTDTREGDEDVEYRVILAEAERDNKDAILNLPIANAQGRLVRLGNVVSLRDRTAANAIHHFDGERVIIVTGEVETKKLEAKKIVDQVLEHFDTAKDYPGVRFVVGGEAEETAKSMRSLFIAFGIAAVAILFLLILLFNSWIQPLVVMAAIPFGFIGVILAFFVHNEALGFIAMLGVIGMAGVVVNDSLVLVSHINNLRKENPDMPLLEIVAQGTSDRLRAITLTTLSTLAGLMPLAYGVGGYNAFMGPMALALAYGLLFATPLTLVLIPCFYLIAEDVSKMCKRMVKAQ